ncbi:MAG: hypothetical protein JKY94_03520 [Rhodobacteraceae bacterium]|nr:hypothetical protein [Paracoccaceae bacterium]
MSLKIAYWIVFAVTMAIYLTMLTWTLPAISADAAGLVPFDMRPFGYTPDEARSFLAALGDRGRALYLGPQHRLDLLYPVLLAIVLAGAVAGLIADRRLRVLLYLAILGGMFSDYTENTFVALMLKSTEPVPDRLALFANNATVIKSGLTGFAMIGVLGGLVLAGIRRWTRK